MPMCADICTNEDRDARFQRALDRIVRVEERERHGIGMQKEKTLHAVLKAYEDPDEDHHEIPIGSYIADIYSRETESITEIQTPLISQISGSSITAAHSKIIVRTKEMIAEVTPSFSAVKNPDEKMPKPIKMKDIAKIRKPEIVNDLRPLS